MAKKGDRPTEKQVDGRQSQAKQLLVPLSACSTELMVRNSRFIADCSPVFSAEAAREFINTIKASFPDASHHVPAYIIGHGESTLSFCTDAGEPFGSAGRPILTVLQGSGYGDVVIVVTRYFGGTKLGVGGLVRAYTDAAKAVLERVTPAEKVKTAIFAIKLPYPLYERAKLIFARLAVNLLTEEFSAEIQLKGEIRAENLVLLTRELSELSNGQVFVELIETERVAIFPILGNEE